MEGDYRGGAEVMTIERLKTYYEKDDVFITAHAAERFRQRGIRARDVRNAVHTGEIIEQYPNDFPYPSCLILGQSLDGRCIHVVMSDEGTSSRIITAYVPDVDKWSEDFKTRRGQNDELSDL